MIRKFNVMGVRGDRYTGINNLINDNRHITRASKNYFSSPQNTGLVVTYEVEVLGRKVVIGVSGCQTDPKVDHSITVVHKDFRGLGIGAALLQEIVNSLPSYHATVASDNPASIRLCEKVGLYKIGESLAIRQDGAFTQYHYSKLIPKNNNVWDYLKSYWNNHFTFNIEETFYE